MEPASLSSVQVANVSSPAVCRCQADAKTHKQQEEMNQCVDCFVLTVQKLIANMHLVQAVHAAAVRGNVCLKAVQVFLTVAQLSHTKRPKICCFSHVLW